MKVLLLSERSVMEFREFGDKDRPVVMLLHGGGLNWWNYREQAELLAPRFHVILPILDGHAGSSRAFTSIADNAAEIIDFIDAECVGKVLLAGGLSLGAQILLEMLAQRGDVCRYAFVESAAVIPSRVTHAMIGSAFGSSYALIKNRRFARLQAKSLHIRPELFEDYYRDTCAIAKENMISFLKANTAFSLPEAVRSCSAHLHVFAGSRENGEILKSVKILQKGIPGCSVKILPGLFHGEFSLNHAGEYTDAVISVIEGGKWD